MLVAERAGVIAPEPGSAGAAGYADVLLDGLFRWHLLIAIDLRYSEFQPEESIFGNQRDRVGFVVLLNKLFR